MDHSLKRPLDGKLSPIKRRRLVYAGSMDLPKLFDDLSLERDSSHFQSAKLNLLEDASNDDGYISGFVKFVWSMERGSDIKFSLSLLDGYEVHICCVKRCLKALKSANVRFTSQDVLKVSLRGSILESSTETSEQSLTRLVYKHGIMIQFVKRVRYPEESGRVLNTFSGNADSPFPSSI
jgi:hypothetical protein